MRISGVMVTIENEDGTFTNVEFGGDTGTIISGGTFSQSVEYDNIRSIYGPDQFERTGRYQFNLWIGYQYKPTEEELKARAEAEEKQREANRKWNEEHGYTADTVEYDDYDYNGCDCDICWPIDGDE